MTRPECAGTKDSNSDRCDLYDSEGYCLYYGDTWEDKDGVFRGGEDVECITYCTQRTIKGKRINDSMNPLHMERLCRWMEVVFDGEIRSRHEIFYNPTGIIVWGDGTMHDPETRKTIYPDGTVVEDDGWRGNKAMRDSFERSMEHIQKMTKKLVKEKKTSSKQGEE